VPLAEWLDGRFRAYRYITTAVTYAYTIAIPVSWFAYGLFPTVVALVIYIQAYKLLHRKEDLDYHHIFLMSFFLLVAACVLNPDALIALPFFTFLISAVASFFALQVHGETRRCTGPSGGEVVPLNLRRPTYSVRREHFMDGGLIASYTAIIAACILMTMAFFVATPRMQAGVLGGTSMQPVRQYTGLSDSVDLSQGGPREVNTAPVMRVYTPNEPGGRYLGDLYWRNTSFDRFNGTGWDNVSESAYINDGQEQLRFNNNPGEISRSSQFKRARLVRQTIYLDDIPAKGLPALPWIREVHWKDARLTWDVTKGDTTVDVVATRRNSLLYEVTSEVVEPSIEELRSSPSDYHVKYRGRPMVDEDIFARLTYQNLSEPSLELARRVTDRYTNNYDKVAAIQSYLTSGAYLYSLGSPKNLQNPVDNFILTTRSGHCELFASAMALMVRSIGIPARVVSGYRGGDWDPNDQSYTVRSSMAHLWVEVYFIGQGWVRFDPSPPTSVAPQGIARTFQQYVTNKLLKGKMAWYQNIVGYSARSPLAGFRTMTIGIIKELPLPWQFEGYSKAGGKGSGPLLSTDTVAWILLLGLAVYGWSVLRRRRREGGQKSKTAVLNRDQQRAIQLYRSVLRRIRRTVPELEGKTAEEIARMLTMADAQKARQAQELLQAYTETRFGGRPMSRAQYLELQKAAKTLS
jgi:transglutaminase-like putative cysteine protease